MIKLTLLFASLLLYNGSCQDAIQPAENTPFSTLNPNSFVFGDYYLCKRLFTSSGVTGCGSSRLSEGDRGTLFSVESESELVEFEADLDMKEVSIVLSAQLFTRPTIDRLIDSGRVSSLLVKADNETRPSSFSPSEPTSFNPDGDGLNRVLIPFPVALLGAESTALVSQKVKENKERGYREAPWQHAVNFLYYQGRQSADTQFCLDLGRYRPVGGFSVWGTIGTFPSRKKSVMLTTHLDSSAVFPDLAFGAEGTASGLIALLGAIHALGEYRKEISLLDKQIIFAFFQGEEWDRVGSRRFVYDLSNGCLNNDTDSCIDPPVYNLAWTSLNLSDIEEIIALDQVANYFAPSNYEYFIHTGATNHIIDSLNVSELNLTVLEGSLPSTPLSSFLENEEFAGKGVVLSGYNSTFSNPYYRSRFDYRLDGDTKTSAAARLTSVATTLARAALKLAGSNNSDIIEANLTIVTELEHCLTRDFSCSLVQSFLNLSAGQIEELSSERTIQNSPKIDPPLPSFFPGFYQPQAFLGPNINSLIPMASHFVRNFAAYYTEPMLLSEEERQNPEPNATCISNLECSVQEELVFCNDTSVASLACIRGRCMCVSTHFQDAYSTGIKVDNGNFEIVNISADSLFAEVPFSLAIPELRFYQAPQISTTLILFLLGAFFTVLEIVAVIYYVPKLDNTKYKLREKID